MPILPLACSKSNKKISSDDRVKFGWQDSSKWWNLSVAEASLYLGPGHRVAWEDRLSVSTASE